MKHEKVKQKNKMIQKKDQPSRLLSQGSQACVNRGFQAFARAPLLFRVALEGFALLHRGEQAVLHLGRQGVRVREVLGRRRLGRNLELLRFDPVL